MMGPEAEKQIVRPAIDWEIAEHNYDLCPHTEREFKRRSSKFRLFPHHLYGITFDRRPRV